MQANGPHMAIEDKLKKPSLGKRMGRWIAPLVAAVALHAQSAKGELIWSWYNDVNPNNVVGEVQITNDNDGAVYDSYQLTLGYLADAIFDANSTRLQSLGYNSGTDLVADGVFSYTIEPNPISEVYGGWNSSVTGSGDVSLANVGGIPGLDYDVWNATQQVPSQDMQRGTLGIDNYFLDLTGDGYDPATDLTIANGTNLVVGGQAYDSGNGIIAQDYASQIIVQNPNSIPEPATGFVAATIENGLPTLLLTNNMAVIVQRMEGSITNTGWQNVTNLPAGTNVWSDGSMPEGWGALFYRLAK